MATASAAAIVRKSLFPPVASALSALFLIAAMVPLMVPPGIWRPLFLSLLPVLLPVTVSLLVAGAVLAFLLVGSLGKRTVIGTIRTCMDEYREAQQRFSPAWHRAQAGRRRGEYRIVTTLAHVWATRYF